MLGWIFVALMVLAVCAFFVGRSKALSVVDGDIFSLHSKPNFHGAYLVILSVLPAFLIWVLYLFADGYVQDFAIKYFSSGYVSQEDFASAQPFYGAVERAVVGTQVPQDANVAAVAQDVAFINQLFKFVMAAIGAAIILFGALFGYRQIAPRLPSRHVVERTVKTFLFISSILAILTTIGIVFSLIFETIEFFTRVSIVDFFTGTHWKPEKAFEGAGAEFTALELAERNGRVFGSLPVFAGTLLITLVAMTVAVPIGLFAAIYLSEYASNRFRAVAKPLLEILAGVPTVVYGFFAALTVAPFLSKNLGPLLGLDISFESALAAGLVMGIMIIPFVSSLSDDVINAVPQTLRDGSAGLGATKSETIRKVVLPAALPGIVSAIMLAVSRAIGETMIVVMAAGSVVRGVDYFVEHFNPFESVTTVTVQIVSLLVGDTEFGSAKTLSAFALGLSLFIITLILNVIAIRVIQKYREAYD